MRFPGEDVEHLTMQQLRGREGARIRNLYRQHAKRTSIEWIRRDYDVDDFDEGDDVNRALTVANTCLYGIVHSVVLALGCSPGLGFIHTGNDRSFVYDIADLYKADLTIPLAFDVVAEGVTDISSETRRRVRDAVVQAKLLERCSRDILDVLLEGEALDEAWAQDDSLSLWSGRSGDYVPAGVSYGADR